MPLKWNTLITSGAYIGEEMQAEFGRIPPAFLPIGSSLLVQHQLREAKGRENIWLSLPNDYEMTAAQLRFLDENRVRVFRVEPRKTLGLSIFQAILEIGPDFPLEIMHGDTLVLDPSPPEIDLISVSRAKEQYKWGLVDIDKGLVFKVHDADTDCHITSNALILSGYFSIREPWRLLKALVSRDFSFTGALDSYATELPVAVKEDCVTLDCGHLKTFYDSRRNLAAARYFNSLQIEHDVVRKRSSDKRKIDAEANWLRSVPANLQPFTARLLEDSSSFPSGEYSTLYSSYPTLAELYLARTPQVVWSKVFKSCIDYMERAVTHTVPKMDSAFEWLVIEKLHKRIAQYPKFLPKPDEKLTINGQPVGTLNDILAELSSIIADAPQHSACIMHGDFCFSNILFDLRSDRIQLIDPRGLIDEEMTIFGDLRYDIAKLGHSVVGRYDQILGEKLSAGGSDSNFVLEIPPDLLREWLEDTFFDSQVGNQRFSADEVKVAMVSLFLSMVPLHMEDAGRQRALFANGLRLFARFFRFQTDYATQVDPNS